MNKFLLFVILIPFFSFSQNTGNNNLPPKRCVSPILNSSYEVWIQDYLKKNEPFANSQKTTIVYNIPVIFHVVHNGEATGTGRNISKDQIHSQINILNSDFRKTNADFNNWVTQSSFINVAADCEINFSLANVDENGVKLAELGIDRINRNSKGWTGPSYQGMSEPGGYIDNTIKPNSYWDPNQYFNIWVIDMSDGVLGYAQFPVVPNTGAISDLGGMGDSAATDGVVLDYRAIGDNGTAAYPYNKGRTATHEIGHWLGLRHINGDSNCGNDYCTDTPLQNALTTFCPTNTGTVIAAGCGTVSPDPPGKMYQNYMDYSDDRCLVMFTQNQKTRMQACLANCIRRHSLTTSDVSVKEHESIFEFDVFPNPSSGDLSIMIISPNETKFSVTVINPLGQMILKKELTYSQNSINKIDLTEVPNGVYFVKVNSKTSSKTKRIILNK